ncbi:MAG TPA: hypothetical protein PKG82_06580 [Myxococcota bacterium]|nr:hypothetical protein [Myxococcota bacterium]
MGINAGVHIMSNIAGRIRRHVVANRICCWNVAVIRGVWIADVRGFNYFGFISVSGVDRFYHIWCRLREPIKALVVDAVPVVAASAARSATAIISARLARAVPSARSEVAFPWVFA